MGQLKNLVREIERPPGRLASGRVVAVKGALIQATLPGGAVGDLCRVWTRHGTPIPAQLVSFHEEVVSLAPFADLEGIFPGAKVESQGERLTIPVSDEIIGRIIDPLGNLLDLDQLNGDTAGIPRRGLFQKAPAALLRTVISNQVATGIKGLDLICPLGYGQRVGLIAGAGVGKSTLLGMIARNAEVDLSVIALVGERGREVKEFIEDCLGAEGRKRSVVVVATSDEPSLRRMIAAYTATTIAEHFRARGLRVLLLVDSLTRMARAIREVGLADGELPVRHGYTATVYTELPRLVERAGTDAHGSITGIYTLLGGGDDEDDPLAEEVKSVLDGHIVLSNKLALRGLRPAIDYTRSISRLTSRLLGPEDAELRERLLRIISRLNRDRDIVLLGGTPDAELQAALTLEPDLDRLLCQRPHDKWSDNDARTQCRHFLEHFTTLYSTLRSDSDS